MIILFILDVPIHILTMAMSGVELDPECKLAYDSVQLGHQYRYVTFKIQDGKVKIDKVKNAFSYSRAMSVCEFETLQKGGIEATYDQFLDDLKQKDGEEDDCRYAIYDYKFVVNTQGTEPSARYPTTSPSSLAKFGILPVRISK